MARVNRYIKKEIDEVINSLRDKDFFKSKVDDMLEKLEKQRISALSHDDRESQSKMNYYYTTAIVELNIAKEELEESN